MISIKNQQLKNILSCLKWLLQINYSWLSNTVLGAFFIACKFLGVIKGANRITCWFTPLFAEREGFEPPVPLGTTVFKTVVIDHSTISPEGYFVVNLLACLKRVQRYRYFLKLQNVWGKNLELKHFLTKSDYCHTYLHKKTFIRW